MKLTHKIMTYLFLEEGEELVKIKTVRPNMWRENKNKLVIAFPELVVDKKYYGRGTNFYIWNLARVKSTFNKIFKLFYRRKLK